VLRILDDLEALEHVTTTETVKKGRAQKLYIITEKGKAYLNELKESWSERLTQMIEFTGPHMMGGVLMKKGVEMIIKHQLDTLKTKEDAIDLFRGLRSKAKTFIVKISERVDFLKNVKSELDSMIQEIEYMEEFDLEEIKNKVEEFKTKLNGEDKKK
jgi:wobble nucleotide-excising tRNase